MQIGFNLTAAVPKRVRAVEEQPVQQAMRGDRKITQAPSTDQKKVRRAMQRKTAANFSAGDCRMCGGNLIPMGRKTDSQSTMKAQCADCGTKHELQGAEVKKVSALAYEAFQNLPAEEKQRLEFLADFQMQAWFPPDYQRSKCPHCGASKSRQHFQGTTSSSTGKSGISVECDKCKHSYSVGHEKGSDYGYTAARRPLLVTLAGSTWEVVTDTTPYLSAPSMSAIARRAHSVLDTEETP